MGCCCIYPWPSQDTCKLCFTLPQSLAGQGMLLHLPVAIPGHMSAVLHSAAEFGWARDAAAFTRGHPRTHVSCASLCSSVRLGMGCCCIYPWPSQDTCKLCFTLPQSLAGQGMLLHLPVAIPGHMSAVLHSAAVLGWAWDAAAFTRGHPRTHVSCASLCSSVRLGMGCCCIYPWPSQDTCQLCFTLPQSLAGQGMLLHLPVAIPGHM